MLLAGSATPPASLWVATFGQALDQGLGARVDETEVGSGPLVLHRRLGAGKKCWGMGGAETGSLASSSKGL